jgi:hypothetical protein
MDIRRMALIDALALVTDQYARLARDLAEHAATRSPQFVEIAAKVKEAHKQVKRACADLERHLVEDHHLIARPARIERDHPN